MSSTVDASYMLQDLYRNLTRQNKEGEVKMDQNSGPRVQRYPYRHFRGAENANPSERVAEKRDKRKQTKTDGK